MQLDIKLQRVNNEATYEKKVYTTLFRILWYIVFEICYIRIEFVAIWHFAMPKLKKKIDEPSIILITARGQTTARWNIAEGWKLKLSRQDAIASEERRRKIGSMVAFSTTFGQNFRCRAVILVGLDLQGQRSLFAPISPVSPKSAKGAPAVRGFSARSRLSTAIFELSRKP